MKFLKLFEELKEYFFDEAVYFLITKDDKYILRVVDYHINDEYYGLVEELNDDLYKEMFSLANIYEMSENRAKGFLKYNNTGATDYANKFMGIMKLYKYDKTKFPKKDDYYYTIEEYLEKTDVEPTNLNKNDFKIVKYNKGYIIDKTTDL